MRILLTLAFAAPILAQQTGNDTEARMQQFTDAMTRLQTAVATADRAAITAGAAAMKVIVDKMAAAGGTWTDAATAALALDELRAAATDLQSPVGDGRASDPHDLTRLRRACSTCHAHNRDHNDERGWFPDRGGVVAGRVRLEERDGTVRSDAGGVVVFLESPALPAAPAPRPQRIVQQQRRFEPPVLVVTPGTEVEFPNHDVVFHNVFSLSRGNTFDLGSYASGKSRSATLATPGLVKVHCNIHPEMAAHVLVLATPFAAISSSSGAWCIGAVPDGDYTLRVWQPLADEQRHALTIHNGVAASLPLPLVVRETRPRVPHNDKHGKPYKDKY